MVRHGADQEPSPVSEPLGETTRVMAVTEALGVGDGGNVGVGDGVGAGLGVAAGPARRGGRSRARCRSWPLRLARPFGDVAPVANSDLPRAALCPVRGLAIGTMRAQRDRDHQTSDGPAYEAIGR
jgi:hypothetical protein